MTGAILLTVLLGISIASVLISPVLPRLGLKSIAGLPEAEQLTLSPRALGVHTHHHLHGDVHHGPGKKFLLAHRARPVHADTTTHIAENVLGNASQGLGLSGRAPPASSQLTTISWGAGGVSAGSSTATRSVDYRSKLIGFYVNWDDASLLSLRQHIDDFDLVIPEWLHVAGAASDVSADDAVQQQITLSYIRSTRPKLPVMPLVNNYDQGLQAWDATNLAATLHDPAKRTALAEKLLGSIQAQRLAGINIDFEDLQPSSRADLVAFMQTAAQKFHAAGLLISQSVPANDPAYDYAKLASASDFLTLMVYDEHSAGTGAGPVASQSWYDSILSQRSRDIPANKLVLGIGSYGYDWTTGGSAQPVTFDQAIATARSRSASPTLDPGSLTLHYAYTDAQHAAHQVWLLDAVSGYNEVASAEAGRPLGFALWRLGSEDPSIWPVLEHRDRLQAQVAARLRYVDLSQDVAYVGSGEILRAGGRPDPGTRALTYDPRQGLITAEHFDSWPQPYVVTCWGGSANKDVALTFDDGPDSYWTPQILDILDEHDVPATFFVIGANADANRAILRREYRIGEEIGNHTFTHPDIAAIPPAEVKWQLDAVQRLFEAELGVRSVLFRPPYGEDSQPDTPQQVAPLLQIGQLGYYTVGMNIDPSDWARPGVDQIVQRTVAQVESGRGHIVLLHDGGGDRSQTVAALPRIIQRLEADGYHFVTVSQLVGMPRSAIMPSVPPRDRFFARVDREAFGLFDWMRIGLYWLFVTGVVLGIARLAFVGPMSFIERARERRADRQPQPEGFAPLVSAIVPAYNEERVIANSVSALLAGDYPNLEVIVVDDGSSDRTAEVARATFGDDPRVRVLVQENAGKATALNRGIAEATGEIVIGMDADTHFRPDAISKLVRHFADERIGAVAGNAKVGNRINLLTNWQALEYITNQNLDRRAFDLLNCITVVPGAIGAWRRSLVIEAGGFTEDTLAEDADLTFRLLERGWRVVYEDSAIALTEAPDTVSALVKQRRRWVFGTMQAFWKHRRLLGRPSGGTLGMVAMPNVLVFQIFFPLVSPIMDLAMVLSVAGVFVERTQHPLDWSMAGFEHILFYYALFLALDFGTSAFAFALEPHGEDWSLLWWLFLQRFFYRQLMYAVVWGAIINAVRGSVLGWDKLERKATVLETT